MIKVEKLYKNFDDNQVLKNINVSFEKGKTTVILGSSGSGKSTLLRCLNHLETPTSGNIYFEGELLDKKNIIEHRKEMGMVFQSFNLFSNMCVIANVIYAQRKVRHIEIEQAIKNARFLLNTVGLSEKENEYPRKLSGGQKQRVAIARALAMEPKVLLFDEPTSALDPEMVNEVLDVIKDLTTKGYTSIIVTHEMGFAKEVADYIIFMNDGEIVEYKPCKDFFENPKSERAIAFLNKIL
ncbi:amino acid ABC transporter ATP-binding protein [Mycoplasmatota bacterium]|nr:amino acid ABC transporter ATP-binding protein [Mycoplasmatota bacterium]